jgi:hypothetical protein
MGGGNSAKLTGHVWLPGPIRETANVWTAQDLEQHQTMRSRSRRKVFSALTRNLIRTPALAIAHDGMPHISRKSTGLA